MRKDLLTSIFTIKSFKKPHAFLTYENTKSPYLQDANL